MIFGVLTFGGAFFSGCATKQRSQTSVETPSSSLPSSKGSSPTEVMGPPEPFGPPAPEVSSVRPAVVVLGPGLARGFAYVGVFRALSEAKITIGAILGTEMGGLVAALYGLSSNLNQFEWDLLKFKEDVFVSQKGLFSKLRGGPADGSRLEAALRQAFVQKDLSQSKIPLQIAFQSQDTGVVMVLDRGNAAEALRATLSVPRLFTAAQWPANQEGVKVVSNASRPFLVQEAKRLDLGPVIVVDVLSGAESTSSAVELKAADLVLKPDLSGINYMDFQKRTEAAFRGKKAVQQRIREIQDLVGMAHDE